MQDYIYQRVIDVALEYMAHETPIREMAKMYGVSKTTIELDLNRRLPRINKTYWGVVRQVAEKNFEVKAIRGGEATKRKYKGAGV